MNEIIGPDEPGFTREAARSLLRLKFGRRASQRIRRLLQKNNRGTITAPERLLMERYLRVGQFLDLVHAKARLSLHQSNGNE